MDETDYFISDNWHRCIAVLADIHARKYDEFLSIIKRRKVDYIFVPGDFVDGKVIERTSNHSDIIGGANNLLNKLSKIAPTYYSLGNHEKLLSIDERETLRHNNALALFDEYCMIEDGYKILLCHHPEYYNQYLKNRSLDLVISGHAHGGQVRIGNQGLYALGPGIFPKYTSGIHHSRLIISRGIAGTELLPRLNNNPEIVYIHI